ncbi:hypothetical protein FKW77_008985 [Venturia effusa]|uniref:Uncharacterized protein n=1 Tax=Venturia effusa TaxID=50376 RepID=A0A517LEF8_9PEZI|nr:hypothetical protein FKW77_008985 [Venturia effusa]
MATLPAAIIRVGQDVSLAEYKVPLSRMRAVSTNKWGGRLDAAGNLSRHGMQVVRFTDVDNPSLRIILRATGVHGMLAEVPATMTLAGFKTLEVTAKELGVVSEVSKIVHAWRQVLVKALNQPHERLAAIVTAMGVAWTFGLEEVFKKLVEYLGRNCLASSHGNLFFIPGDPNPVRSTFKILRSIGKHIEELIKALHIALSRVGTIIVEQYGSDNVNYCSKKSPLAAECKKQMLGELIVLGKKYVTLPPPEMTATMYAAKIKETKFRSVTAVHADCHVQLQLCQRVDQALGQTFDLPAGLLAHSDTFKT